MPIWLAIIGVSEYDSGIVLNDDENEAVMDRRQRWEEGS